MEQAYNDSQGITAAFNKNILYVVNHLLETNFDPDDFDHVAFFNEKMSRIEMHLVSREKITVKSPYLKEPLTIAKGDSIHTENCRKFLPSDIEEMATVAGLNVDRIFSDVDGWFSMVRFIAV
jgi:L-histidine N-alpha-methyltransferase